MSATNARVFHGLPRFPGSRRQMPPGPPGLLSAGILVGPAGLWGTDRSALLCLLVRALPALLSSCPAASPADRSSTSLTETTIGHDRAGNDKPGYIPHVNWDTGP